MKGFNVAVVKMSHLKLYQISCHSLAVSLHSVNKL